MTHVAETHVLGLLLFVTASLAFDNGVGDTASLEEIESEESVMTSVHRAVKHLLNDVVDHVVKEVVPREAEEEALLQD